MRREYLGGGVNGSSLFEVRVRVGKIISSFISHLEHEQSLGLCRPEELLL